LFNAAGYFRTGGAQLVHAVADCFGNAGFQHAQVVAELQAFGVQPLGGVLHGRHLGRYVVGKQAHFRHQGAGHLFHARGLAGNLGADEMGAIGNLVDGGGQFGGGVLQVVFKRRQGGRRRRNDAGQALRVLFQPAEQGLCLVADDEAGFVQGVALALKAFEHQADAFFVGAEGTLDVGHFLVNDAFQLGGALHRVLNATNQLVDFAAHHLRDRREAFGGNVLRADKAHCGLHERLRDVVHLVGAEDQVAKGEEHGDRDKRHQQGAGGERHVLDGERVAELGECRHIENDPDHQPDHGHDNGRPDRGG
jgi:hypothetical protein